MKCFFCKGQLENKPAAFMTELDKSIVVIKDVPSQVCRQCGEVSYCDESAKQIEKIIGTMEPCMEIAVVHYADKAA